MQNDNKLKKCFVPALLLTLSIGGWAGAFLGPKLLSSDKTRHDIIQDYIGLFSSQFARSANELSSHPGSGLFRINTQDKKGTSVVVAATSTDLETALTSALGAGAIPLSIDACAQNEVQGCAPFGQAYEAGTRQFESLTRATKEAFEKGNRVDLIFVHSGKQQSAANDTSPEGAGRTPVIKPGVVSAPVAGS